MNLKSLSHLLFSLGLVVMTVSNCRAETGKVSENCSFQGKKLFGKVQVVNSFPDVKVQVVTSFPDLKVKLVDAFANECGKWQMVESFPDLKIQFVDSFPDIKIQYVESFPGIR